MEDNSRESKQSQMNVEFDCGPKCRSKQHALELIRAVTKGTSKQSLLFLSRCYKACTTSDEFERSVLHVAASCGKVEVLQWLLDNGANVGAVDKESAYTALHRAVFYGQLTCARLLVAHGCSMSACDREGLTPLDLIMKDRFSHVEYLNSGLNELYTWGVNPNSTLGHDSMHHKKLPERLEYFRKRSISIKSVVLSKYHSVFLSNSGKVYTCGHGLGGRLGHHHKNTLVPEMMADLTEENCVQIAASSNHTVILTESFKVYTCGYNNFGQLGCPVTSGGCSKPTPIVSKTLKGKEILGVCAGRYHTVLYTKDTVYTCGLNAGQIGHSRHPNELIIAEPRVVSGLVHKDTVIHRVVSSDAATIVATQRGDVFALHDYQCTRIIAKWVNIVDVSVTGGKLDSGITSLVASAGGSAVGSSELEELSRICERGSLTLTVFILTSTGHSTGAGTVRLLIKCKSVLKLNKYNKSQTNSQNVHTSIGAEKLYIWREADPVARRCVWSVHRPLSIIQFSASFSRIAMVTKEGETFIASLEKLTSNSSRVSTLKSASSFTASRNKEWLLDYRPTLSSLVEKDDVIHVDVKRVALVHRATAVFTDHKGQNYAVLQANPSACITSIPSVSASVMQQELLSLLNDSHTSDDIHDVILQVGLEKIACHKFILSSKSEFFRKQFNSDVSTVDKGVIPIPLSSEEDVSLFKQLLKFIYTDDTDLLKLGTDIDSIVKSGKKNLSKTHSNSDDWSIDENLELDKISAYEMKVKTETKGKKNSSSAPPCDPLSRLGQLAKEYGVPTLAKRLASVYSLSGRVALKAHRSINPSRPTFPLKSDVAKGLADVRLLSEDGVTFDCHKCVLVSRSHYFTSMFSLGWSEMSSKSSVKLSIPGDVLYVILEYFYTDNSTTLANSDDAQFVCNVLAVADQLLIGRLKEICEVALSQLITLRNAADILEFSSMFGAEQLKETCHQFISINLSALIETRSLDLLPDDVMDDLSNYYRRYVRGMDRRIITPYEGFPDVKTLESLEQDEFSQDIGSSSSAKKSAKPKKKSRSTRSISESKEQNSQSGETSANSSMISVPAIQLNDGSSPTIDKEESYRLMGNGGTRSLDVEALSKRWKTKADLFLPVNHINSQSQTRNGNKGGSFTQQTNTLSQIKKDSAVFPPVSSSDNYKGRNVSQNSDIRGGVNNDSSQKSLRDIMYEEEAGLQAPVSPTSTSTPALRKQTKKVSQKERKLQNQGEKKVSGSGEGKSDSLDTSDSSNIKSNPWKTIGIVVESFKELILNESKTEKPTMTVLSSKNTPNLQKSQPIEIPKKENSKQQNSVEATSPEKSCWGLPLNSAGKSLPIESPSPKSPSGDYPWMSQSPPVRFADILVTEQQQLDTLHRTSNKPLAIIQREERAISALLEMYGASDNVNEYITVERVHSSCTRPLWAATQRQHDFL